MGHGRLLRLLSILHAISIFDRVDLLRVAEHTVLAAEAFEMVHNLMQDWASTRPSIALRNSFSFGVAYKVRQIAKKKTIIQRKLLEIMSEKLRWKRYVSRP